MNDKQVVLIRKQDKPFTVNFPTDGRLVKYLWIGTNGNVLNKKSVPFEVYDWLANYTSTFTDGSLVIAETDDEEINDIKSNLGEDIALVEKSILTKAEIEKILTTGNQNVLKKELIKLTNDLSPELAENQKRYVVGVAREIGIDSSSKRKVIAEWAGLDCENVDLVFDKELQLAYEE